jgi:hypothetical protein
LRHEVEIHPVARKHGVDDQAIAHVLDHPVVVADILDEEDPSRSLVLGPDRSGNLLEVVVLHLDDNREIVIHATPMRSRYQYLLPPPEGPTS